MKSIDKNIPLVCSTVGEFTITNATIPESSLLKAFPAGQYLVAFNFTDELDGNILNAVVGLVFSK
jgi:hypothetical protein